MGMLTELTRSLTYLSEDEKSSYKKVIQESELFPILQQDPYTRRSFQKPWGYAGDAGLIDYIYLMDGPRPEDTLIGREIWHYCMQMYSCKAVRYRAQLMAEFIEKLASQIGTALEVFAIASGYLREFNALTNPTQSIKTFYAIDAEQTCVSHINTHLAGLHAGVSATKQDLLRLILGKDQQQAFDLVYALGIFDYLEDKLAIRLINRMLGMCKTGGKVLFANFCPGITEQGYMEFIMDWYLIYRDESGIRNLLNQVSVNHQIVDEFRDPWGRIIYYVLERV